MGAEDAKWLEKHDGLSELQVVTRAFVGGLWLLICCNVVNRLFHLTPIPDQWEMLLFFSAFRYALHKFKLFRLRRRTGSR